MNKRQRKKHFKKITPKEEQYCNNCGRKLDLLDEYQRTFVICNKYCYWNMVGISIYDFCTPYINE